MRLMGIDRKTFPLKRAATAQSGYVGTKNSYQDAETVTGQLSAATDRFSVEIWGDRAASMFSLVVDTSTDIRKNDRVTLPDGDYTVVSVLRYQTHLTATLEKAGAHNGS